ncbi:hypothetical protein [Streptomyces sp. NPDC003023]|uniref:hypothetical protein n=1 Tax=Streptomyces sp. NPDC003023 TaxID=3364675 RepID=UPI00369E1FB7
MPDHFDRLLARYTPLAAADRAPARVRPRLPGPFERVEALRYGPPEPDEPAALIPSAPAAPPAPSTTTVRHEHEVRTDRHTVVRTQQSRPDEGAQPDRPAPEALLRPAAAVPPPPRPVPEQTPRGGNRSRAAGSAPDPRAAPAPAAVPPSTAATVPAVASPVPRGSDTAAVRGAARGAVGRRAPKPAERVVHVQIGRLEVSAAPPPGRERRTEARSGRAAPALTLDDYLSRAARDGKRD